MPIVLISTIKPKNNGTFPMVEDIDFKGGFRAVADATERDAIPDEHRKAGMLVYVQDEGVTYKLGDGLTNDDWTVSGGVVAAGSAAEIQVNDGSGGLAAASGVTASTGNISLGGYSLATLFGTDIYFGIGASTVGTLGFFSTDAAGFVVGGASPLTLTADAVKCGKPIRGNATPLRFDTQEIGFDSSDVSLDTSGKEALYLNCTGTTGGAQRTLSLNNIAGSTYNVTNNCEDGILCAAVDGGGGPGVVVPPGKAMWIRHDGNDYVKASEVGGDLPTKVETDGGGGLLNDYDLTDGAGQNVGAVLQKADVENVSITGFAGGWDGRELVVINGHAANNTLLVHDAELSEEQNRILSPSETTVSLTPGFVAILRYDGSVSRWRIISTPVGGGNWIVGEVNLDGALSVFGPAAFDGNVEINTPIFSNGPNITASPAISTVTSQDGKVFVNDYAYSIQTTDATPTDIISSFSPTLTNEAVHAFDGQVTAIKADGSVCAVFDFKYRGRRDGGTWTQNEAATVTLSPAATSLALAITVTSSKLAATVTGIAASTYRWGIAYRHQITVP